MFVVFTFYRYNKFPEFNSEYIKVKVYPKFCIFSLRSVRGSFYLLCLGDVPGRQVKMKEGVFDRERARTLMGLLVSHATK